MDTDITIKRSNNETQHKLALVIPYYKIDFFEKTIQSVASQSNRDFALYIGNDASPDDPLPVIEKYFSPEDYQYFNYTDNLGGKNLALQWERILDHVKEDWFQILGDDDMIAENFVEEFYKAVPESETNNISVLKFVYDWIDENDQDMETFDYRVKHLNPIDFTIQKYRGLVRSSLSENIFRTKMYHKHRFEKIPLAWGSDDLALLAFSGYRDILYIRSSKVKVRISNNSISGTETMDGQKSYAYNIFREKLITRHSKHFPDLFMEQVITDYLSYCHMNKHQANYGVALYYLKHFHIKSFLKNIKKIYYINKIYTTTLR
ncbi:MULTISPECIES: glycosyltransferase family 2 protein [Chryseobacterium]|uniref:Glycosyltransferase involved in cell wall biosynthesis n=1 Tax=Chryseobacterium camelliae TaxID=1265445 RepID=A0ABU0TNZ3_9FLAO|nr:MULTISPECIES: glycosyltransferase family 2 protein [Chryseobacterium]MDT3407612.1 glycosyltransferase involved in cell wall biosynthesis [Pseudacidovorax intermedius]MDQ1098536.1 glycosyltransferase involved in cell wall biosynthesis [Chryseobacterium camelliae]MDQ1102460.1 glycosyltransferase involved in cell wall biosynthesis [Chryseobacterium sp. SORGH_AS_1048]MDR6085893.1 glycosyltransferase involved in cell wall biosynthesis [Chryseobacterium sp. SORGH_AS_0909]MDR6130260.1 glycosyltran